MDLYSIYTADTISGEAVKIELEESASTFVTSTQWFVLITLL